MKYRLTRPRRPIDLPNNSGTSMATPHVAGSAGLAPARTRGRRDGDRLASVRQLKAQVGCPRAFPKNPGMLKHMVLCCAMAASLCGVARAQTPLTDPNGVWVGTLPDGGTLELRLQQDQQGVLSGQGLLNGPAGQESVDLYGEGTVEGILLLQGSGMFSSSTFQVEMQLEGDTAQGRLVRGAATPLTLRRVPAAGENASALKLWNNQLTPFSKFSPLERYRLDFEMYRDTGKRYNLHLNAFLSGVLLTEAVGAWTRLDVADAQGVELSQDKTVFTEGRLSAWNYVTDSGRSYISLKTPDALFALANCSFQRIQRGVAGESTSSSAFDNNQYAYLNVKTPDGFFGFPNGYTFENANKVGVTVTLVQP